MPRHAKAFCTEVVPNRIETTCRACTATLSGSDHRALQRTLRLHYKLKHKDAKPVLSASAAERADVGRIRRGRWQDSDAPKVDQ